MSDLFKWIQKVPRILTVFLVIALGITLANLLWMIVTPISTEAHAANTKSSTLSPTLARQENYGKLIADQHLFGAIPKAAPTKIKAPAPVKVAMPVKAPVKLNLKLNGIISSKTEDGGFAMISYNGKTQEVYSPGETIPKKLPGQENVESIGVMVTKVNKDSVTIDNNGTEQVLKLPENLNNSKSASNSRGSSAARGSAGTSSRARVIKSSNSNNQNAKPTISTSGGIQTLAALREEAMVNPNVLMTVITPSIVRENGQMTGVRVYPSRNRKLFRALGLRNGDVITQVNGIMIDDQSKGWPFSSNLLSHLL